MKLTGDSVHDERGNLIETRKQNGEFKKS